MGPDELFRRDSERLASVFDRHLESGRLELAEEVLHRLVAVLGSIAPEIRPQLRKNLNEAMESEHSLFLRLLWVFLIVALVIGFILLQWILIRLWS